MIPWFWFLQVDYFSEGAESLLRIHNIILVLWVVSPKVQSDASMIIETTLRTVEMAVESCRSQGVSFPKELLLWGPKSFDSNEKNMPTKLLKPRELYT